MLKKLLGTALLVLGGAALGYCKTARLDRRVGTLRAFCTALETIERELSFRLTGMPDLLTRLAREMPPPANAFFAACHARLGELGSRSFATIWRESLRALPMDLCEEALGILAELGDVLGQYDGENQRGALALARERLRACSVAAAEERARMGKVYGTVSLTGGVLLTILLL